MSLDVLSMGRFGRKLVRQTCTASLDTVYTVPPDGNTQVVQIDACNGDPADYRAVTVKIGGIAVLNGYILPPGHTVQWDGLHVLHGGETIQIQADLTSVVAVNITGIEGQG